MNTLDIFNLTGCGNLPSIKNGNVVGKTHYGGSIEYGCDKNYKLVGEANHTCLYGGKWSHRTPFCQGMIVISSL